MNRREALQFVVDEEYPMDLMNISNSTSKKLTKYLMYFQTPIKHFVDALLAMNVSHYCMLFIYFVNIPFSLDLTLYRF